MSNGLIAAIAGLVATLALVIVAWPRRSEREVLAKSPRHLRALLFLPSSSWREVIRPIDPTKLLRLRRASLAVALACVCFPLLVVMLVTGDEFATSNFASGGAGIEAATQPSDTPGTRGQAQGSKAGKLERTDREVDPRRDGEAEIVLSGNLARGGTLDQELDTLPPLDAEEMAKIRTPKRLYGDAKINPHYKGNDLVGVRVRNVDHGSFWYRVGLRHEDLIVEVNGARIDNADATNELMNALAEDQSLRLRVVGQDGEDRVLDFEMPSS